MTDTLNRTHTHYYGFDFYIEENASVPQEAALRHTSESTARQWTKEINLKEQGNGPRLVFLAKSGKLFAHRGVA